uniref:Uncharacterized protein n=2 Tax=viral metagenome TaxID=1070528 RepID=A0A6M3JW18_9ZZZZ
MDKREKLAKIPVETHLYKGKRYLTLDGVERILQSLTREGDEDGLLPLKRMREIVQDNQTKYRGELAIAEACIQIRNEQQALTKAQVAGEIENRPKIVCLCGSTRFIQEFQDHYARLTDEGCIVLTVGRVVPQHEQHLERKKKLDELHLRKIDLADEVLVLNVGGYIGESTANEIAYAEKKGKPVKYLEARYGGREMNFRKKPVTIQAIQWDGKNLNELRMFMKPDYPAHGTEAYPDCLIIATLEGNHRANIGDWIIRGVKGEFYPCKPDIFQETYEPVSPKGGVEG